MSNFEQYNLPTPPEVQAGDAVVPATSLSSKSDTFESATLLPPPPAPVNQDAQTNFSQGSLTGDIVAQSGRMQSENFVSGSSGWQLRPDGAEINGGLTVDSLDIPDTTTANSSHTDTSGNSWWGANVVTGYTGANAYVLATGAAKFKDIQVGGQNFQYVMTDSGYSTFGDGNDGTATFNGTDAVTGASRSGTTYTLTRDVYYTSATVSTGVTIKPAGYRIFCTTAITLNGTALIERNGNNGSIGVDGSSTGGQGGAGGAALADGYLKGSVAGSAGGDGAQSLGPGNAGLTGTNTSNSIGSNGTQGGAGGSASGESGGAGGTVGTATAANVRPYDPWHVKEMLDIGSTGATVKYDNSAASTGGGGGGCSSGGGPKGGGGGGGGGSAGGIMAIYAKTITVGASASITATGGNGGAGGGGGDAGGGGGGGAGGNGGQIILVYNVLSNSGSITAAGGSAGAAGAAGGGGNVGNAGAAGATGTIRQFNVSL